MSQGRFEDVLSTAGIYSQPRHMCADWKALGEKKAQNTDIGPAVITLLVQGCLTE